MYSLRKRARHLHLRRTGNQRLSGPAAANCSPSILLTRFTNSSSAFLGIYAPAAILCPPPPPPYSDEASLSACWRSIPFSTTLSVVLMDTFVRRGSSGTSHITSMGLLLFSFERAIPAPIPTIVSGYLPPTWIHWRFESSFTPVSTIYCSRLRINARWLLSICSASR